MRRVAFCVYNICDVCLGSGASARKAIYDMKATRLKSGSWSVNVYLGQENGKSIRKRFTGSDKKEVLKRAAAFSAQYRHTERGQMTVRQAMTELSHSPKIGLSTQRSYGVRAATMAQRYPRLFDTPLAQVTSDDFDALITDMQKRGMKNSTIRTYIHSIIAAFSMQKLRAPLSETIKRNAREYVLPDDTEIHDILSVCDAEGLHGIYMIVTLGAFGSLRAGEIAAIDHVWDEEVDFTHDCIHVRHDLIKIADGRFVISPHPKTRSSIRDVYLPHEVMERLKHYGYATRWTTEAMDKHWRDFFAKHPQFKKFRIHDLRHYCASLLHAWGYPDAYIKERTGHSPSSYVLECTYTHTLTSVSKKVQSDMTEDFAQLLSGQRSVLDGVADHGGKV